MSRSNLVYKTENYAPFYESSIESEINIVEKKGKEKSKTPCIKENEKKKNKKQKKKRPIREFSM